MSPLLIYREDLKILLIGNLLPSLKTSKLTEVKKEAVKVLGFSVETSGRKYRNILLARRIFGNLKIGGEWVEIEEAAKTLNLNATELQAAINEDIDHWANVQINMINEVFERFKKEAVEIYLWGGWAVDFLTGKVSRPHVDIDTLVWEKDKEKVRNIMENLEFKSIDKERKFQNSRDGVQFDNDFVEVKNGEIFSSRSSTNKGLKWNRDTFEKTVTGKLNNISVPIINPKSFYLFLVDKYEKGKKSASDLSSKTRSDLEIVKNILIQGKILKLP